VDTVTALGPTAAFWAIVIVTARFVTVPFVVMVAVTPVPLKLTAVAFKKFVPRIVEDTTADGVPEFA
jgi:hypothetical protein